MTGVRLYLLAFFLLGMLLFLQWRLWFQSGGLRELHHLKTALALQAQQNESLKQRNLALLFQVQRLQHSEDAVEARARNELGMIKKNETFYQVVK